MTEINAETAAIAVLVLIGINLLILMCAVLLLLAQFLKRPRSAESVEFTGTGTFCGHCGRPVPSDPVRAVAMGSAGFFVYKCPSCENETLLPSQSVG